MATWDEVKNTIKIRQQFVIHREMHNALFGEYVFDNGRTQSFGIKRIISPYKNEEWVEISSPVGDDEYLSSQDIIAVLEIAARSICGGIIKSDGIYFMRHSIPIEDISYEELLHPFAIILKVADEIEQIITRADIY